MFKFLTCSLRSRWKLNWLISVHSACLGKIWKANDRKEPMWLLIDRHDDKVFLENIHILRPTWHSRVTFLRCSLRTIVFILIQCCQPLVEELTEDVTFCALLGSYQVVMNILEIEIDDDIVQVIVWSQTQVIVCCNRNSPATWWIRDELFVFAICQPGEIWLLIFIKLKKLINSHWRVIECARIHWNVRRCHRNSIRADQKFICIAIGYVLYLIGTVDRPKLLLIFFGDIVDQQDDFLLSFIQWERRIVVCWNIDWINK